MSIICQLIIDLLTGKTPKGYFYLLKIGEREEVGQFELPTEDDKLCFFMDDTLEYEYFKPGEIDSIYKIDIMGYIYGDIIIKE